SQLTERIWETGRDYGPDLLALLQELLRYGTWQEALARASAELLEGARAVRLVDANPHIGPPLWPSQLQGIAQALWCLEHVGGVLVADATGSGKTRLGAHLIDAVMQRFLRGEGRAQRRDLRPLLVCPPNVKDRWLTANDETGLRVEIQSDGVLSQGGAGREQL